MVFFAQPQYAYKKYLSKYMVRVCLVWDDRRLEVSCIILNICLCIPLLRESFETSHSASRFQHMFGMNSCVREKYKHGVYDCFYNMDVVCFNFKFLSIYICLLKIFSCFAQSKAFPMLHCHLSYNRNDI